MEGRNILLILCLAFFVGIMLSLAIHEAAQKVMARRRRRKAYYTYLERHNLELERKVNFYRLQAQGIGTVEVKE